MITVNEPTSRFIHNSSGGNGLTKVARRRGRRKEGTDEIREKRERERRISTVKGNRDCHHPESCGIPWVLC